MAAAAEYLTALQTGSVRPGNRLAARLDAETLRELSAEAFLEILTNTKRPQVFAESAIHGDGSDWTQGELGLLGDLSIVVPVTVFDDGAHQNPYRHDPPFKAKLLFTPGALLRNDQGTDPADWREVRSGGEFDQAGFTALYRRRLLPVMKWVNAQVEQAQRRALITIPGMGCGQFAGIYRGQLGAKLEAALIQILEDEAANLPNIQAIWYDPYQECDVGRRTIGALEFITNPLVDDIFPRPQLSEPRLFGFADCDLYSFVAWDHVSWPGNDYYVGERSTDDGVKAAATDVMRAITGMEGQYNAPSAQYLAPDGYTHWIDVVLKNKIRLKVADRLFVA